MSIKTLIIEDNEIQALQMSSALREYGLATEIDTNAEDALASLQVMKYDIITLDLNLPGTNGLELMKQIRAISITTPIVVVSGANNYQNKLLCFEYADDYIEKPFKMDELILRLLAVKRRSSGFATAVINFGNLSVNTCKRVANVNGKTLPLTKKEYTILELMMIRQGSLICKEIFLDMIYNNVQEEPGSKILDVFNFKLRKKLDSAGASVTIKTFWGRGSMLVLKSECQKEEESLLDVSNIFNNVFGESENKNQA